MKAGDKVYWTTRNPRFGGRTRIQRPAVLLSPQTARPGWSSIMILDGEQRKAIEARTNDLTARDDLVPELDKPARPE